MFELDEARRHFANYRQLLGGIIATFRAGGEDTSRDLVAIISSGVDLSQLAAHVRNNIRAHPAIDQCFQRMNFTIDDDEDLPSPEQILRTASLPLTNSRSSISEEEGLRSNQQSS